MEEKQNQHIVQTVKEMNRHYPHRLTPAETPIDKKKLEHDEITRQIAEYLAKGKAIQKVPHGVGKRDDAQNF